MLYCGEMQHLKLFIFHSIQWLYRKTSVAPLDIFSIGDSNDPLFGHLSGTPVDRVLIENFLGHASGSCALNASGNACEVGSLEYIKKYFPESQHFSLDFVKDLEIQKSGPHSLSGDLCRNSVVAEKFIDIIVLTQVLSFTENPEVALTTIGKILKPGGFAILTDPFLTPISMYDEVRWGEFSRFTERSLKKVLNEQTWIESYEIGFLGNSVTSAAIMLGIPAEQIEKKWFDPVRKSHATVITAIIKKSNS